MDKQSRYHRQEILKGFGQHGQQLLSKAKVLVIGAGGLGCPVLQYLAAAGIGSLGIADDDVVDLTNLHRQVLFDESDFDKGKAEMAARKLKAMNAGVTLRIHAGRVNKENARGMMQDYDVVVDCTDNFPSRYLINDACVSLGLPLVWAAVSGFEGQVAVFNWKGSGNYRDLFPEMPAAGEVAGCSEAGVLGVLPGIIGTMQAMEVIKLVTGIGTPLVNQLLTYRALDNQFLIVRYQPAKTAHVEFGNRSYEDVCAPATNGMAAGSANVDPADSPAFAPPTQLDWDGFAQLMQEDGVTLIDVRDLHEQPEIRAYKHLRVPLYELDEALAEIRHGKVIFVCQTGMRSMQASMLAADKGLQAFSVRGGIQSFEDRFETLVS